MTKKKRDTGARASGKTMSSQAKIYNGVTKDPLDLRDLMYEGSLRELPLALDNRGKVPFILDQGQEGACTGFGLAATVNFLLINHADRSLHPAETVSARMLYEMAKRYDEWEGENYEGSSIRGAMKGWHKHGVCSGSLWPYSTDRVGTLTPQAQLDALDRPLGKYFRVRHHHLDQMHSALVETGVLYASAQVHAGWNRVDRRTGCIPFLDEMIGGHAFAIVGYDRDGFWVQNSWGDEWGLEGFCHLTYDDWLENGMDCWVARLGVPTRSVALGGEGSRRKAGEFGYIPHEEVVLSAIRPHFVNLGNDGRFSQSGRYSTDPYEVEEIIQKNFVERTSAWGGTPRLMLYAHGGLNDETASASRVASLLPYFLDNQIYPLHFMWETGVGETISGVIQDAFRRGRMQGWVDEMRDRFLDLLDEAIELGARPLGKPMWSQMKQNAEAASTTRDGGARYVATKLADFAKKNPLELHLIGHSAGSIFHGHLILVLVKLGVRIKTLTLFAPACTMSLFEDNILKHLGNGIERLTVFNLSDQAEQDDSVARVYHKSLLYLVSEAFETKRGLPLAGMDRYWTDKSEARKRLGEPAFRSEYGRIHTLGGPRLRLKTDSLSHGGFDNDEDTLNSALRIMLGKNRLNRAFVRAGVT